MRGPSPSSIHRSLTAGMLFQFAIGGSVIPFITILFRDRSLDYSQISLIFFAGSCLLLVMPFLWGMLADRFIPLNRLFTLMNLATAAALLALSREQTFLGLLICFTLFYICFNPTLTLMNPLCFAHLTDPRTQFGGLRAWGSLGWILPSIPIYIWLAAAPQADLTFTVQLGFVAAVAMTVVSLFLPHTPPGAAPATSPSLDRLAYFPALRRLLSDANYVVLLLAFFLMSCSFSLLTYFSPPRLEELGIARAWLGPIQCIGVVLEIALFRWRALLVSRLRYSVSILIGCGALCLRHLLFAGSSSVPLLCASYLLAGVVIVFFNTGCSLLIDSLARAEVRSTAQTLLVLAGSGLGPMFATACAHFLAQPGPHPLRYVFWFAAASACIAGALILWRAKKLNQSTEGIPER